MSGWLRIVMAQMNLLVGDMDGNVERMCAAVAEARDRFKGHVVVFPELALIGYPPEDLLLRPEVGRRVARALQRMEEGARGIDVVVGYPLSVEGRLYNAASWLRDGHTIAVYRKCELPNYSVFDERRYFVAGAEACVVDVRGVGLGLTICEDIWTPGPVAAAQRAGAAAIVNINASPYHTGKWREREEIARLRVRETGCSLLYTNLVGGQDELIFDGSSFAMDRKGQVLVQAPAFREGLHAVDLDASGEVQVGARASLPDTDEGIYEALVLGVRDYVRKNGFRGVLIGLSGGIDSALTLALAVDALGAEAVRAVMMPSPYTSELSLEGARAEAARLGIDYRVIPIHGLFDRFITVLAGEFDGAPAGVTGENLQARIRGMLLMAISNESGRLVLTTGNKSEMAVGYATLYGDMAGGFAVIKDVSKTQVYRLAEYVNRRARDRGEAVVIPDEVVRRPPSAELAPGQKDSDSLPPYEILDPIIEAHVERNLSIEDMITAGLDGPTAERVVGMIRRNEYKRRQAPPGVRITRRAFGRDWRYPITCGYPSV
ncbi:MAG: NAD+ synthase [Acidiferrobacteraceae bacterium]